MFLPLPKLKVLFALKFVWSRCQQPSNRKANHINLRQNKCVVCIQSQFIDLETMYHKYMLAHMHSQLKIFHGGGGGCAYIKTIMFIRSLTHCWGTLGLGLKNRNVGMIGHASSKDTCKAFNLKFALKLSIISSTH